MLAAFLGAAPAQAVTVTIDEELIVPHTDTATNSVKLDSTLSAGIDNAFFADGLADIIALANPVDFLGTYNQTGNIFLTTQVLNTTWIVNSGDIDPVIGIEDRIANAFFAVGNASSIDIATGANVLGDLTQEANHVLAAELINSVDIGNSANVTADNIGIVGEISNNAFVIGTASESALATGADILGFVTQAANSDQETGLTNSIVIVNDGEIDANIGITAGIFNSDFALGNADAVFIAHGFTLVGDLTQSAGTTQSSEVGNIVAIENNGDVAGGSDGIAAVITNYADVLSVMGNASETEIVSGVDILAALSQSAEVTQSTVLRNTGVIVNRGDVEANDSAIAVTVSNIGWDIGNASNADIGTGFSVLDDHTQTVTVTQSNEVANNIFIDNLGRAEGGQTGIAARIVNTDLEIGSVAFVDLESSGGSDAAQTANFTQTNTLTNNIAITNSGEVRGGEIGVLAQIESDSIVFDSFVDLDTINPGAGATQTVNVNQLNVIQNDITITNSGSIEGGDVGIVAEIAPPSYNSTQAAAFVLDVPDPDVNITQDVVVESSINIVNTGTITADSLFAIDTEGAATTITNQSGGVITGFIDLTEYDDLFDNRAGGTFQAREESDFGDGFDQFVNRSGGTVHAIGQTSFVNLDRFTNSGVISLQNFKVGDVFEISNTAGQNDLDFVAQSGSTLVVDAFLGGPGSKADNFIINGDVSGRTLLRVNNTSFGPGALNREGIPVVFANGNVKSNAFFLEKPIDTGLFDYDLHFVPTGSGFFELRSHPGGGSHVLPHILTAAQDVFFIGNDTWFDRSADLRVLLNGGAPVASSPNAQYGVGSQPGNGITPAVWVKGSGTWFEQDDKAKTQAYGRTYRYDLNRDLDVAHFQTGVDFGARDVLSPGDLLIYGVLGGAIFGNLEYNQFARQFDMSGGEVGAYATYLKGGLFVDTLLKADFVEFDPNGTVGYPGSFDSTAWGVRTDAGYRFGSFSRGLFFEPLATIAFNWVDVEDFAIGGNKVVLHDESVIRGRLGLRVGTSTEAWTGTLMEPFIIGSVWSNLGSDTNSATLTSHGEAFHFQDDLEEVWGVVSAGVNFFNVAASTSVFAKLDVTFGDETEGISGKGGFRYNW